MATPSAIHHMLAILSGDAPADGLARLIGQLGWGGLAPDPLDGRGDRASAPRFVRLTFPGIAPTDAFIVEVTSASGLRVESLAPGAASSPRWLLIGPQPPAEISTAVARLRAVHRIHAVPFTTIEDR
jgi:hypothetical protein